VEQVRGFLAGDLGPALSHGGQAVGRVRLAVGQQVFADDRQVIEQLAEPLGPDVAAHVG
jgi:hypothetical protein